MLISAIDFETLFNHAPVFNLPGVWLTGDLTNHNAESAIFVQQADRRVELHWWTWTRKLCIDVFPRLKQDNFWCLFMFILCYN